MNHPLIELNLIGFPGPTHYFGGLGYGNIASAANARSVSSPRQAALQAIVHMSMLLDLGIPVALVPPQPRPIVVRGELVASSSFMWTANAATVISANESVDGRTHFTPANLISNFHRAAETIWTRQFLGRVFYDPTFFFVHEPIHPSYSDEGAANWTRLDGQRGGIYLGVYGRSVRVPTLLPRTIVPRQTKEAMEWICRQQNFDDSSVLLLQQSPAAIEIGVFHNDVIATGTGSLYLMHELSYTYSIHDCRAMLTELIPEITLLGFSDCELTLSEAVGSYWFNSQIVKAPDGALIMIAPDRCRALSQLRRIESKVVRAGLSEIRYVDLGESLKNGGGPACVRLRVPLTRAAIHAMHDGVVMTGDRLELISQWVKSTYREAFSVSDLEDPYFAAESNSQLSELYHILNLADLWEASYNFEFPTR